MKFKFRKYRIQIFINLDHFCGDFGIRDMLSLLQNARLFQTTKYHKNQGSYIVGSGELVSLMSIADHFKIINKSTMDAIKEEQIEDVNRLFIYSDPSEIHEIRALYPNSEIYFIIPFNYPPQELDWEMENVKYFGEEYLFALPGIIWWE